MFSSKELISFVFANENDTYYGDDLIKRDVNQYLWEQLHGSHDAVYFLSAEDSSFCVRSYGDLACSPYVPKKKKLFGGKSAQKELGDWIQRQLHAKPGETAAFVCPLEDFCEVLSDDRWDAALREIVEEKKRTGIFVLTASTTAERTTKLLLESPVFEKLRETAVTNLRGGTVRELYGTLKKQKGDSCVFLNTFSWERIRALLLHLVMEYPDRFQSNGQLNELTEYLYACLQDQVLAAGEPLFREGLPAGYSMYSTLYARLSNERTWKAFEMRSADFAKRAGVHKREGNTERTVPILRDVNSYAGRCLKMKLPKWIRSEEAPADQAGELLRSIQQAVSAPKNRLENGEIAAAAENFLNQLDAVSDGDSDTYNQILSALRFCVNHVYAQPQTEDAARALEIIQKQGDAITVFRDCFLQRRNLKLSQSQPTGGKLQSVTQHQLEAQLSALEQLKKTYLDLIRAKELEMTMHGSTENVKEIQKTLERELENYEQIAQQDEIVEEAEPEHTSLLDTEPEEKFILTSEDYNFVPPKY